LALKGNQGKLNKQVRKWFKQAVAQNWKRIEYSHNEKTKRYYRLETAEVWTVTVNQLPDLHRQDSVAWFSNCCGLFLYLFSF
jgi:uncharacterized protein with HEPN domain